MRAKTEIEVAGKKLIVSNVVSFPLGLILPFIPLQNRFYGKRLHWQERGVKLKWHRPDYGSF